MIASLFEELADIMEIAGENQFKIRAYRNAGKAILNLGRNVAELNQRDLHEIPGIGDAIAEKIASAKEGGTFPTLEKWRQSDYAGFRPLLGVPDLTARKLHRLIKDLHIKSMNELRAQIADGRLAECRQIDSETMRRLGEYLWENDQRQ